VEHKIFQNAKYFKKVCFLKIDTLLLAKRLPSSPAWGLVLFGPFEKERSWHGQIFSNTSYIIKRQIWRREIQNHSELLNKRSSLLA